MKTALLFVLVIVTASFTPPPPHADSILGVWKNSTGKGHVEIYRENGRYHGRIAWLRDATDAHGRPRLDFHNADPSRQNKPLLGLTMLRNFRFEGGEWNDGHIYNPGDGREYRAFIRMKDHQTLLVRGYLGISLLGKSDTWTRVK
jgi:uncharacterized protein (DUF2147 family)